MTEGKRYSRLRLRGGFTLPEAIIALAVWAILSVGVTGALFYTTQSTTRLHTNQDTFEQTRASLDALTSNLQLADTIVLETVNGGILKKLTLTELDPDGKRANYIFYFDINAKPEDAKYQRLEFGLNDEFASGISEIRLLLSNEGLMTVTVTGVEPPLTLTAMVDVRYKKVTVTAK